jgi:acetyl/propionyl-CoA carboxylase alpha subunit
MTGAATLSFYGEEWEELVAIRQAAGGWQLERGEITEPLRWWRDQQGVWTIDLGDKIGRFAVVVRNDTIEIVGNGGRWLIRAGQRPTGQGSRRQIASDGIVLAPLPAKVILIHASPGDQVEQGQPLVTLSAMKIELTCEAPAIGTVETVSCEVGQLVDAGTVLVKVTVDVSEQSG